jgi:amidase
VEEPLVEHDDVAGRLDILAATVLRSWRAMAVGPPDRPPAGSLGAGALLVAARTGEMSVEEVVAARLALLHDLDAATAAVAAFEDERALTDARALDRARAEGGPLGPLHGLPVTVKDWIDVEGFPCAGEGGRAVGRRPAVDATVVARLRAAGAVVVAKTRPWDDGAPGGLVRHPLDGSRTPGGSSSGEAVAVAAGASLLGIGSDSGGSIRLPAAWCGVLGFKPTAGRVPTTGHFPRVGALSDGRTQIGPLAADLDTIERVLPVIAGPDGLDPGVAPVPLGQPGRAGLGGGRFAVLVGEGGWVATAEVVAAVEAAAKALAGAGLERVEWTMPWLDTALDITRRYWGRSQLDGAGVAQQLWDWDRFRRRYVAAVQDVDLLLTPTVAGVAPQRRDVTGEDFVFTLPASLTGSPAITVPAGPGADGLPLAVQLIGRPWEDRRVLAASRLLAGAAGQRAAPVATSARLGLRPPRAG